MELECRGLGILVCFRPVRQRNFEAFVHLTDREHVDSSSFFSAKFGSARTADGLAVRGRWNRLGRTRFCRYDVFAVGAVSALPARGNSQRTRRMPPHCGHATG